LMFWHLVKASVLIIKDYQLLVQSETKDNSLGMTPKGPILNFFGH
jgi:hypothetical protein